MIPKRVWLAVLIAFFCHGLFILSARYRFSYDAYTHMLFANHYAENWFSLWEPRWYTGFTVVSYPPLAHQLVALFIPLLGFDRAFALILWVVTSLYPLGVYSFSRIFTSRTASSYAALASAILLPVYVTAYVFGQFPFLTSTLFALFSAAALDRYLHQGGLFNLLLIVSLYTTTMASHHATLIVQPFWAFAIVLNYILALPRTIQWQRLVLRLLLVGSLAVLFGIFVIWPFWDWGTYQTMQTPIDHLSRHNFFTSPLAFAIFFFPLYGPLAAVIPFLFRKWHLRFIGILISFVFLCLLGLGGTTPLPRSFFGPNWEWLTYDRFAFWASLTLTPFFGILFIRLKYSRFTSRLQPASSQRRWVTSVVFSIFAVTALGSWLQPIFFSTQPAPINMKPIVEFLNQDDRSQWRYLTFGFGNQFAYLNLLTTATTIDGSYHTVRTLPELRKSGIAEVDTAYWALKGIPAIGPILEKSGDHSVRWGFVNRAGFIPELQKNGWIYKTTLSNKVQVWENPKAVHPKPSQAPETSPITAFSWGVFPILSLITTLSLGGLRVFPVQTERVLRALHALMVGLVPVSICFWYYFVLIPSPHPRVYFTYTDTLVFFTDAFMISAVLLWGLTKLTQQPNAHVQNQKTKNKYIVPLFFVLALFSSLSIFWSQDWHTSLYISVHLWLIFLFVISLRDWHGSWKVTMFGLCAALAVEIIAGFAGFGMQSTEFLQPFKMEWPGILDPSMRGVSVVQLADGLRVLRAYGTLPHPNLLGGFAFVALLGTSSLFLTGDRSNYAVLILHSLGIILIGISFSRSAWLGLFIFIIILLLKLKCFERKRVLLLIAASLLTVLIAIYPLWDMVSTRIGNSTVNTEHLSAYGRIWLTEQAVDIIREHPLTGVGIGSFILQLADHALEGALIEPVHNIFLLAGSELGMIGLILVVALFISIALEMIRAKSPQVILAGATLAGLGVISLFDHYIWSLAPGRVMLGLTLGLWLGRIANDT